MADATGSSAGAGGDLGRGIAAHGPQYQVSLTSSVTRTIAPNVYPQATAQQCPAVAGLIPGPAVGMPVPPPRPVYSTPVVGQSQPPRLAGRYQLRQDYPAYGNTTTPPLGFSGWGMYSNPLMSSAQTTLALGSTSSSLVNSSNGFHQNSSPSYATTIWTNYVPSNLPYYTNYAPALQALSAQTNNNNQQKRDLGFATSFGATAPAVPALPYEVVPQRTRNSSTSSQLFQEVKNLLDGTFRTSGSGGEIEGSEDSEEQDPAMELEAQNQLGQGARDINATSNIVLNCKDYHTVLQKDLTNSDCGPVGRIVLPKRDAEANLPALIDKDGIMLEMDDLELPEVWNFKYRYWPNNKSRMYIMETTGEFVKRHNLQAGDKFIIYRHKRTRRHVARAVKAFALSYNMNLLECRCMEESRSSEECGFAVRGHPPRRI